MSYAKKLSVIALSLSMAFVMLIGTAGAKDAQPKGKKGGPRVKKDRPGEKGNRRKGSGQAARLKAVRALVDDLAKELGLDDAQKVKAELIVKKHMRTITAPRGKGPAQNKDKDPGAAKKPGGKRGNGKRGGGKRGGGKKKDPDAGKPKDGAEIDRF
jgi:hypothetical protein